MAKTTKPSPRMDFDKRNGEDMFFIWLGTTIAGICCAIGEYLIIRVAVRDGMNDSDMNDWKATYLESRVKYPDKLPPLNQLRAEIANTDMVKELDDPKERENVISSVLKMRARKKIRQLHRDRFIIAIVATTIAAIIGIGIAFGGAAYELHEEAKPTYSYSNYSN